MLGGDFSNKGLIKELFKCFWFLLIFSKHVTLCTILSFLFKTLVITDELDYLQ